MIRAVSVAAALAFTLAPAGTTERVSVSGAGEQADAESWADAVSADGRLVLFDSHGSDLVPGDTNGQTDVFVRDRQTGQTTRVDVASDGKQAIYAPLLDPFGVTTDLNGSLLVADTHNNLVRSIDASGTLATIAGNGTQEDGDSKTINDHCGRRFLPSSQTSPAASP